MTNSPVPQPQWPSPPVLASSLPWTAAPRTLAGHTDEVRSVAFSPDGSTLASADLAGAVRLWDLITGNALRELTCHAPMNSVAYSPDGLVLATASHNGTVRLWDLSTGQPARDLTGPTAPVNSVAFSPDGSLLAASTGPDVWLWDLSFVRAHQVLAGGTDAVVSLAFSPDGSVLATSALALDGTVQLWESSTRSPARLSAPSFNRKVGLNSVAFRPDGLFLTAADDNPSARLWDLSTGREVQKLTGHKGHVKAVAFSPDVSLLAGITHDTVWLWDSFTGHAARKLTGQKGALNAVAFSPGASLLATGGTDKIVRVWDGG